MRTLIKIQEAGYTSLYDICLLTDGAAFPFYTARIRTVQWGTVYAATHGLLFPGNTGAKHTGADKLLARFNLYTIRRNATGFIIIVVVIVIIIDHCYS